MCLQRGYPTSGRPWGHGWQLSSLWEARVASYSQTLGIWAEGNNWARLTCFVHLYVEDIPATLDMFSWMMRLTAGGPDSVWTSSWFFRKPGLPMPCPADQQTGTPADQRTSRPADQLSSTPDFTIKKIVKVRKGRMVRVPCFSSCHTPNSMTS